MEYSLRTYNTPYALEEATNTFRDTFVALKENKGMPLAIHHFTTLTLARHIHISTLFEERQPYTEKILALCEQRLAGVLPL